MSAFPGGAQIAAWTQCHGGQLARFALVGIVNTLIDVAVWASLYGRVGSPILIANSAGYAAGLLNSYVMNRRWTFRERRGTAGLGRFLRFALVSLAGLGISNLTLGLLVGVLPALPAKLLAVVATLLCKYLATVGFVFPERPRAQPWSGRPGSHSRS
jgi:putative flippase GtrA